MEHTLTQDQQEATKQFTEFLLDRKETEMVLSGPPGTGKSTLTQHLLEVLGRQLKALALIMNQDPKDIPAVHVTATTNKAARVIGEMTDEEPMTIFSLIGLKVTNDYKTGEQKVTAHSGTKMIHNAILFIDEASFLGPRELKMIRAYTSNCKILWIGDEYQLAPLGNSKPPVFSEPIRHVRLKEVVRNEGPIAEMAAAYRDTIDGGPFPLLQGNGKEILEVDGPTFQKMIDEAFLEAGEVMQEKAKILAWTNKRVLDYGNYVRSLLGRGEAFEEGEWVVTNKPINDGRYSLKTEQLGRITQISEPKLLKKGLSITGRSVILNHLTRVIVPDDQALVKAHLNYLAREKNWREYFEIKETWGDLRSVHASTTHKSQGSTYDKVFIDLSDIGRCNIASDVARMLNVAISRAKHQVILYGQLPAKYQGVESCNSVPPISVAS